MAAGDGGAARVIAGNFEGIDGPAQVQIPIRLMDVCLSASVEWTLEPESGNDLFVANAIKTNGDPGCHRSFLI